MITAPNNAKPQLMMSEAAFQSQVVAMCHSFKLRCYHTYDSRRSAAGFPDLTIVGRGGHMFRELKTEVGRLTEDQIGYLNDLRAHRADADVWRPTDLVSGRIERELRALSDRSRGRCQPDQEAANARQS